MRRKLLGALLFVLMGWGIYYLVDTHLVDIVERLSDEGLVMESPELLWGSAAVVIFWIVSLFSLADLHPIQRILSALIRTGIALCLVVALTNINLVTDHPKKVSTIVLVDSSASIPDEALDKAYGFAKELYDAKGEQTVRVFSFSDVVEEVAMGEPGASGPGAIPRVGKGTTSNLEGALRSVYGLFDEGTVRRVVIISDGLETSGNIIKEVDNAKKFGVTVSTKSFPDVAQPEELLVKAIEVPEDIVLKQKATFSATFFSNAGHEVDCTIEVNDGELKKDVSYTLDKGLGTHEFDLVFLEGGKKRLDMSCKATKGKDFFSDNNEYTTFFKVPEIPKVLYVEGEKKYRKNLLNAISKDFEVEFRGPSGLPKSLAEMKKFDLIFISDLPRFYGGYQESISYTSMKALEQYVKGGGGLVVSGGEQAFGPGGYTNTYLEKKVLPVTCEVMKKKSEPGLALALVIDRSGSMSGQKMELAKEAAKATTEVLAPDDMIAIVVFDDTPTKVVKIQKTSNKLKILTNISKIMAGGGTEILPALKIAHKELTKVKAKVKHVILLTDGQSQTTDGIIEETALMYAEGITMSTVAVGAGSDRTLLSNMAKVGGGRYYFTDRAKNIPKLFLKEATTLSRQAVVDEPFKPKVMKKYAHLQMLKGINFSTAPFLLGYIATKPKSKAKVLMKTHLGEPLLVSWRLGLGKVVVWTSDVKNRWSHYWLPWSGYAKFWRQVIRDTARSEKEELEFAITPTLNRGTLDILVDAIDDDGSFVDDVTPSISLIPPEGDPIPVEVTATAPGIFQGSKELTAFGPYQLEGSFLDADGDLMATGLAQTSYPYPDEFLEVGTRPTVLGQIQQKGGGSADPTIEELLDPGDATYKTKESKRHLLLWLAFALLFLDLLVKRIRLVPSKPLDLFS